MSLYIGKLIDLVSSLSCALLYLQTLLCPLVLLTATNKLLVSVLASDALGKEDPSANAVAVHLLQ